MSRLSPVGPRLSGVLLQNAPRLVSWLFLQTRSLELSLKPIEDWRVAIAIFLNGVGHIDQSFLNLLKR
nr:hypothetical protein [Methylobacterium sp. Leaf122]